MQTLSYSKNRNIITLIGNGSISTTPTIAIIQLGVETSGEPLDEVQSLNADISQQVLSALYSIGVDDIKTHQYRINKNYEYYDGNQIDKGYTVSNIIEIQYHDMSQVGRLIDIAVNNGANVVNSISFDVEDKDYYYEQALNMAIMNAMEKAKAIGDTIGLPVEPLPISITEHSPSLIPPPTPLFARGEIASTPIVSGEYTINATVTAEFR